MKRCFDIIGAVFALILFSPLFLFCYLSIRMEDGKPVIYKQERIGFHGKPFYIYKFRSMRIDAEKDGPQLLLDGKMMDPRLTKIGKFLRAHHLDELPQLWNVLVGDMSFVGYRPERKYYIEQIMKHNPRYEELYQVRPGITSMATIFNGYTDTMDKMLRRLDMDLYYLKRQSLSLDMKILMMTFFNIMGGKKF